MSLPRIGQIHENGRPTGVWEVEGYPGTFGSREEANAVAQSYAPTPKATPAITWQGAIVTAIIVVTIFAGLHFLLYNTSRKYRAGCDGTNGGIYEVPAEAPAVRYQQPARYPQPAYYEQSTQPVYPEQQNYYQRPAYRQVAPRRQQRQIPPGCYYVIELGETRCPPKEWR